MPFAGHDTGMEAMFFSFQPFFFENQPFCHEVYGRVLPTIASGSRRGDLSKGCHLKEEIADPHPVTVNLREDGCQRCALCKKSTTTPNPILPSPAGRIHAILIVLPSQAGRTRQSPPHQVLPIQAGWTHKSPPHQVLQIVIEWNEKQWVLVSNELKEKKRSREKMMRRLQVSGTMVLIQTIGQEWVIQTSRRTFRSSAETLEIKFENKVDENVRMSDEFWKERLQKEKEV